MTRQDNVIINMHDAIPEISSSPWALASATAAADGSATVTLASSLDMSLVTNERSETFYTAVKWLTLQVNNMRMKENWIQCDKMT